MNRLRYFDALRGLAAIIIVLRHLRSAFYPFSAFGASSFSEYAPHSTFEAFLSNSSLGLLASGNFALPLFFVLSGYILSFKLIGKSDVRSRVLGSALKRPIRLVGMIWFSMIISYILGRLGWYFNNEIAPLTTSVPWFSYYWAGRVPSLLNFLRDFLLYPFSKSEIYNGPLWMMDIELSGSILTFVYLFLVGDRRWRLLVLIPSIFLFWGLGTYHVGFALGVLCGEIEKIVREKGIKIHWTVLPILLAAGWVLGSYPSLISDEIRAHTIFAIIPQIEFSQGYHVIGGAMLLLAVVLNATLQSLLSKNWLAALGHMSYSIFTLHFLVIGSFSSLVYYLLYSRIGHHGAALISIGLSIPLILVLAKISAHWVDDNVSRLADAIGRRGEMFFCSVARHAQTAIRGN